MEELNNLIARLLKDNEVDLKEESVVFSFSDGYISVSLEDGTLDIDVHFASRTIHSQDSLADLTGLIEGS